MLSIVGENLLFSANSGQNIINGLDCRFQQGELTVITGPSACGKTTLARLFCGMDKPQAGKISKSARRLLIHQEPGKGFLAQTVYDEIAIGVNHAKKKTRDVDIAGEALAWAGLGNIRDRPTSVLSFSEQRLLAIAAAWAGQPDFYFFDEPYSGLDQNLVSKIIEFQLSLVKQGAGVIIICYDIERILAHADRLILMKQGRIIADALPERVLPFLESHGVRKPNLKLAEMTWLEN